MTHRCFNRLGFIALLPGLLLSFSALAMVDANRAPPHDLEAIRGIGPSTRERIVQARQSQPFRNWQDFIERVPGIGPATARKLSAQGLTINGQAYASPPTAAAPAAGKTGLGANNQMTENSTP